jgi:hypothetical protein
VSTLARNGPDIAIPLAINSNPQQCAQIKLQDQFELGLGEWFIDTTQGMPYVTSTAGQPILGVKQPNIPAITALFRKVILGTPGIVAVQELVVDYNPRTRNFQYSFAAIDNTGAIIQGGNVPFVVGGVGSP